MTVKKWIPFICLCLTLICNSSVWAAEQVAPGIRQWSFEKTNWEGKTYKGFVLEVDPKVKNTEIRPVLGKDTIGSTETLSSMAKRTGAVAAVNGGFFDTASGVPIGNVFIDGKAEYVSDILRTSFGFTNAGDVKIGYLAPKIKVDVAGIGQLATKGINMPAVSDGLMLYSQAWGKAISAGAQVILKPTGDGSFKVEAISGNAKAPAGGYVLSAWGSAVSQLTSIPAGAKAKVLTEMSQDWNNIKSVLTAGPLLVESGLPVDQAVNEGNWGSLLKAAPRTAMGVNSQGKVIFVVVDGRQDNWSAGLTLEELSYLMIDLGSIRAVALDGGGSSEMWVNGEIVNKPSDKKERALGNGFMIIQQMPVYVDHQRLYLDVAPVIEKGRTLIPMRKIFERLGVKVDWNQETQTITATKGDIKIELVIGKAQAVVNGKTIVLDVPAKVIDGRTVVPMRFVGETLGAKVNYVTTGGQAVYIESAEGGADIAK